MRRLPRRVRLALWVAVVVLALSGIAGSLAGGDGDTGTLADLTAPATEPRDRPDGAFDPEDATPESGGVPPEHAPASDGPVAPADLDVGVEDATGGWTVHNVVDGDTVDVRDAEGNEERVRIIGIDTPERGECGFGPATSAMAALVLDRRVDLVAGARDDRDRYGRILRYVDVEGVDAGLTLIEQGLAIARYDSRDGYGRHDRETAYVAADAATASTCPSPGASPSPATSAPGSSPSAGPGSGPGGVWRHCTEAREAGAAPVRRGDPGFGPHLDGDGDGIGCE